MCLDTVTRRFKRPSQKVIVTYKRFSFVPSERKPRFYPLFNWHGRGKEGYAVGVWHRAEPPVNIPNRRKDYGFRAYLVPGDGRIKVELKGIRARGIDCGVPAVTALYMRIPKGTKPWC